MVPTYCQTVPFQGVNQDVMVSGTHSVQQSGSRATLSGEYEDTCRVDFYTDIGLDRWNTALAGARFQRSWQSFDLNLKLRDVTQKLDA